MVDREGCRDATLEDLETLIENGEDMVAVALWQKISKQAVVVKKVLGEIAQYGLMSKRTLAKYESQIAWLATGDPPAGNPFPVHFVEAMWTLYVENAWPPEFFWDKIRYEAIVEHFPGQVSPTPPPPSGPKQNWLK